MLKCTTNRAPMAQWLEHWINNPEVPGSNPGLVETNQKNKKLKIGLCIDGPVSAT